MIFLIVVTGIGNFSWEKEEVPTYRIDKGMIIRTSLNKGHSLNKALEPKCLLLKES